jgi:tetratricopeptide (TPR) repeat protein
MSARPLAVLAVVCATTRLASAEQPWEVGLSQADRDRANELFAEANSLFAQQAHTAAVEKYTEAIAHWDHPLIRFNMAVTLIRLDRIVEAAEHFETALRYGAAPFSEEQYQRAVDYQKLLRGRVGDISVSCTQGSVQILLDAKPWFTCPGTRTQRVLAGEHLIVGEKQGHVTESRRVLLEGGASTSVALELRSFDAAIAYAYDYRWPRWIPWSVAGGGAALVLGGFGVWVAARGQMDRFDREFTRECQNSCETDLSHHLALRDQRDSALLKNRLSIAMFAVGGAATVGGLAWTLINRPRRVLPEVNVAPTAGGMQAVMTGRF